MEVSIGRRHEPSNFDRLDQAKPSAVYSLDPAVHRTGSYSHVLVPGLQFGQIYGYRVRGPYQPERGLHIDAS